MDGVLTYDTLPPYMTNSPPRDYAVSLEQRTHFYPPVLLEDAAVLRPLDEPREHVRSHFLPRLKERDFSSPPLDEPKTNSLLRDYNISSLIREDVSEQAESGLIDPGKDPEVCFNLLGRLIMNWLLGQVSEYRGSVYRDDSPRRPDVYRRDVYDTYLVDNEVQNLCMKEKPLQLDLSYKSYEGLDDLERIGRDTSGKTQNLN